VRVAITLFWRADPESIPLESRDLPDLDGYGYADSTHGSTYQILVVRFQ